MFLFFVMANFTEKDVAKMFSKMTAYTLQEFEKKRVNDRFVVFNKTDIGLQRFMELHKCALNKKTFTLVDLVEIWYNFYEDDTSREWNETCQLITSFFTFRDTYVQWHCDDRSSKKPVETINLGEGIISQSKNPFTAKELKFIVDYFDNKIKTEEQSKAELYTKIKDTWCHFYLEQEA
jgi:hypothetical protein